jgi:hypothetical protein
MSFKYRSLLFVIRQNFCVAIVWVKKLSKQHRMHYFLSFCNMYRYLQYIADGILEGIESQ